MFTDYINKKVIVRSYDAGVYFGRLFEVNEDGKTVKLTNVRNIWEWQGASCLSQIANDGIKGGKVSPTVESMIITCVCQIIPLSENAINNLESFEEWKF